MYAIADCPDSEPDSPYCCGLSLGYIVVRTSE